jgi:hypothetical protein
MQAKAVGFGAQRRRGFLFAAGGGAQPGPFMREIEQALVECRHLPRHTVGGERFFEGRLALGAGLYQRLIA